MKIVSDIQNGTFGIRFFVLCKTTFFPFSLRRKGRRCKNVAQNCFSDALLRVP